MISLDLRTGSGLSLTLSLPASPESLQWAKENLGITDFAEAEIISAHYEFPYLSVLVPSNLITVESANELASCLVKMRQKDYEVEKYLAILEAEQPETFQGALELASERDNYERVPMNLEAYRKEYKKRFAWIKAGRITAEAFYCWSRQAREKRDECKQGQLSLEEFQAWLKKED